MSHHEAMGYHESMSHQDTHGMSSAHGVSSWDTLGLVAGVAYQFNPSVEITQHSTWGPPASACCQMIRSTPNDNETNMDADPLVDIKQVTT